MMRSLKYISILVFFIFISIIANAKDILIGDRIPIKIKGASQEQVRQAFDTLAKEKDIKLEEIKADNDNAVIAYFRCYSLGENSMRFGNKQITFIVKSSLDKNADNKEIYMDLSDRSNQKLYWGQFPYKCGIGTLCFIIGSCLLISSIKIKRKNKRIIVDPYQKFENGMRDLSDKEWEYEISYLLRDFIDLKYNSDFLQGVYMPIGDITTKDVEFINDLDNYKFSRHEEDLVKYKEKTKARAFDIYNKIKGGKKENV